MADLINEIIQVTITRQTAVAQVASFNGILIAEEFLAASITPAFATDERVRSYTSLADIVSAGYTTSSAVYLAGKALFQQNPNPGKIYVGRKLTGGDGSETWTQALTAMLEDSNEWYGFGIGSTTLADLEEAADWSEANKKLMGISDDDSNIISGTGDIAEYINTNNYDRSFVIYHPAADGSTSDPFANFAWLGKIFPNDPGSANWAHKTLAGVTAYQLTSTERGVIEGKKGNYFSTVAGIDVTLYGWVGSGEYIDIIRGVDWSEARIQELIYQVLINNIKVPFTDDGIQAVDSQLKAALQEGIDVGLYASYETTVPLAADVSATDKGNRLLPDVEFVAILAGAINKVQVNGIVSL